MAMLKPIDNTPIKNYVLDENNPPCYGNAYIQKNNYCALTNHGLEVAKHENGDPIILGRDYYENKRLELENKLRPFFVHLDNIFHNDKRDASIFLDYLAFKMQYPSVKIRWALVIGGDQGIGKDMAIDACFNEYGLSYIHNISPNDILSSYNDFVECMLLRISEVADLQEANRWAFNERLKVLVAGHPDNMLINKKYGFKYWSRLYCGVIITTNHLDNGIYIPKGDRRYYIIKCTDSKLLGFDNYELKERYFTQLFNFLKNGGYKLLGQYLYYYRDVSNFNSQMCPKATEAKLEIMQDCDNASEDAHELLLQLSKDTKEYLKDTNSNLVSEILEFTELEYPSIISIKNYKALLSIKDANTSFKKVSYDLKKANYVKLRNKQHARGEWAFFNKELRGIIYVHNDFILKFKEYTKFLGSYKRSNKADYTQDEYKIIKAIFDLYEL